MPGPNSVVKNLRSLAVEALSTGLVRGMIGPASYLEDLESVGALGEMLESWEALNSVQPSQQYIGVSGLGYR